VTYLELVQHLHSDVGAAGNAPATVVSQRGESLRLVQWIQSADWYIQSLYTNWKFLQVIDQAFVTVALAETVSKPATLKQWDLDSFKYNSGSIEAVEYHKIRTEFFDSTITGPPSRLIIQTNNDLSPDPVPDAAYSFTGSYFKKPILLTTNSQVSLIPDDFHMVILGRAMILYGNYEGAPEVKQQGQEIYGEFFPRLYDDQIPQEGYAGYKGTGGFFQVTTE